MCHWFPFSAVFDPLLNLKGKKGILNFIYNNSPQWGLSGQDNGKRDLSAVGVALNLNEVCCDHII